MCVPTVFLLYEDIVLTDWYTDSLATPHGFTGAAGGGLSLLFW